MFLIQYSIYTSDLNPIIPGSFSSSDISIGEYKVIARKSDGSCIGWGSNYTINLATLGSTTGIYKLYLNYYAYGLDSSGDINIIGSDSSSYSYFRDVSDSSYDTSGKLSYTGKNIPKLSFIDSYTNRFQFATETINGYNYFFTHNESKYQIYSDRLNTSFLEIENTILPYNSDNHFYKFKHYTGGSNNYILIDSEDKLLLIPFENEEEAISALVELALNPEGRNQLRSSALGWIQ